MYYTTAKHKYILNLFCNNKYSIPTVGINIVHTVIVVHKSELIC